MIITEADLIKIPTLVIQITTLETTIIINQIVDDLIITTLMIALNHKIGIDLEIIITLIITGQIPLIDHKAMIEADLKTDIEAVIEMIIIKIDQEADQQAVGRGVRAVDSRGFFWIFRSPDLSGGLERPRRSGEDRCSRVA